MFSFTINHLIDFIALFVLYLFVVTVLATFLMSMLIEVLQPFINGYRSFDVTDLITNTLGGVLGYFGFTIIRPFIEPKRKRKRNVKEYEQ